MAVQFYLPNGKEIIFKDLDLLAFRGLLLPGSLGSQYKSEFGVITLQEFQNSFFGISHRIFQFIRKLKLSINAKPGLRLEAILTGEVELLDGKVKKNISSGQYHVTDSPFFTANFKKNKSTSIFISQYSGELVDRLGLKIISSSPQSMPPEMFTLINEVLQNPYEEKLRQFYYENCVREILFLHLMSLNIRLPGILSDNDIKAIYQADSIISSRLDEHLTIAEIARIVGTNEFKLKKGFRELFGMGVFHRLLFRRMEKAKRLLTETILPIGDIARMAGYDSVASFIHAFRREFGMTPREWRIHRMK